MRKEPNLDILGNFTVRNFFHQKLPSLDQFRQAVQVSGTSGYSGVPRALDQISVEYQKQAAKAQVNPGVTENPSEIVLPLKVKGKDNKAMASLTASSQPRVQDHADTVQVLMNRATREVCHGYLSLLPSLSDQFTSLDEVGLFCQILRDIIFAFFLSSSQTGDVMTKASFSKHLLELCILFQLNSAHVTKSLQKYMLRLFDDFALQEALYFLHLSAMIIRTQPASDSQVAPAAQVTTVLEHLSQLPVMSRIKKLQQLRQKLTSREFREIFTSPRLCPTTIMSDPEKLILGRSEHICRFDTELKKSLQNDLKNITQRIELRYQQRQHATSFPRTNVLTSSASEQGPSLYQPIAYPPSNVMDLKLARQQLEQVVAPVGQLELSPRPQRQESPRVMLLQQQVQAIPVAQELAAMQAQDKPINALQQQNLATSRPSSSSSRNSVVAPNYRLLASTQVVSMQEQTESITTSTQDLPPVQRISVPAAAPVPAVQAATQALFVHELQTSMKAKKKGYAALPQMSLDHEPEMDLVSEGEDALVQPQKRLLPSFETAPQTLESTINNADGGDDDAEPPLKHRRIDEAENPSRAETEIATPIEEVSALRVTSMEVDVPHPINADAEAEISAADTAMEVEEQHAAPALVIHEVDEKENYMFQEFINEIRSVNTRDERKEKMIAKLNELRSMLDQPDFDTPEGKANMEKGYKQFNTLTPADCFEFRGKIRPFFAKVIAHREARPKVAARVIAAAVEMTPASLPNTTGVEQLIPQFLPPVGKENICDAPVNTGSDAQQSPAAQPPQLLMSSEAKAGQPLAVTLPAETNVVNKVERQSTTNTVVANSFAAAGMQEGADPSMYKISSSESSTPSTAPQQQRHAEQVQVFSSNGNEAKMTFGSSGGQVINLLGNETSPNGGTSEANVVASLPVVVTEPSPAPASSSLSSEAAVKPLANETLTEIERLAMKVASNQVTKKSFPDQCALTAGNALQPSQDNATQPLVASSSSKLGANPMNQSLPSPPVSAWVAASAAPSATSSLKTQVSDGMPPPAQVRVASNKEPGLVIPSAAAADAVALTQSSSPLPQDLPSTQLQGSSNYKKRKADREEGDRVMLTLLFEGRSELIVKVKRTKTIGELLEKVSARFEDECVRELQFKGKDLPRSSTVGMLGLRDGDDLTVSMKML